MSDAFADEAARLAGLAGVLLGWGPDVFWSATPAELACVVGVLGGEAPGAVDARGLATLMGAFPDG